MKNPTNITTYFNDRYSPVKALVIFLNTDENQNAYVESYDMDESGCPINAHPLSYQEMEELVRLMGNQNEKEKDFLTSTGIIPTNILKIDHVNEIVIWWTPPQKVRLNFTENLHIPVGEAYVPKLIWKASKDKLSIWASKGKPHHRPVLSDQLYNAPFFNIFENGSVCLGTIRLDNNSSTSLEKFMDNWHNIFWNSNFSHLNINKSPIKGNIVQLWQKLVKKQTSFPTEVLLKADIILDKILKS